MEAKDYKEIGKIIKENQNIGKSYLGKKADGVLSAGFQITNKLADYFEKEDSLLYKKKLESINLMSISKQVSELKKLNSKEKFNKEQFLKNCVVEDAE